jgi:hypothetical protein
MKHLIALLLLIFFGLAAWLFATRLSADALGMAVGLVFGVLAGVPTALLVLAANRRRSDDDDEQEAPPRQSMTYGQRAFPYQPPVIVVTQPHQLPQQWQPTNSRQFRIVGELGAWDGDEAPIVPSDNFEDW